MKRFILFALLSMPVSGYPVPKTGGPLYVAYEVTVIEPCDGIDRAAIYRFRSLTRARAFRNFMRNRTRVKATWIKRV